MSLAIISYMLNEVRSTQENIPEQHPLLDHAPTGITARDRAQSGPGGTHFLGRHPAHPHAGIQTPEIMVAACSFQVADLPALLRYDGVMSVGVKSYLQFTELDPDSASYGASFYLDARTALLGAILGRRAEKQREFALGLTAKSA